MAKHAVKYDTDFVGIKYIRDDGYTPGNRGREYNGQHRGEYKPSFHWWHEKCYPDGVCRIKTETATLLLYQDAVGGRLAPIPNSTTISFSDKSDPFEV